MGEQRNLTEENVAGLTKQLEKMQETNPDLEFRFFNQEDEPQEDQPSNKKILEKLEALEWKIDHIFDGHVLIDGQFKKIWILPESALNSDT